MARLKKLTIYVEAYAEMSRDAGSIPAASTNEIKKTNRNRKADSRNNNLLSAFFVWKYNMGIKFWKAEEDKKTTIKTNLNLLKRDIWENSPRKTKQLEVNLKKTKSL